MLRKLTGILILLSFIMVKNGPLFLFDNTAYMVSVTLDGDSEDQPEETEPSKQLECTDEDILPFEGLLPVPVIALSTKLDAYFLAQTSTAYLSLPYPPPDALA